MPDTTGFGVIGAGTWGELHARTYATTPGALISGPPRRRAGRASSSSTAVR